MKFCIILYLGIGKEFVFFIFLIGHCAYSCLMTCTLYVDLCMNLLLFLIFSILLLLCYSGGCCTHYFLMSASLLCRGVGRILRKGGKLYGAQSVLQNFWNHAHFWAWPHLSPRYNSGINHKSIKLLVSTVLIVWNMQA